MLRTGLARGSHKPVLHPVTVPQLLSTGAIRFWGYFPHTPQCSWSAQPSQHLLSYSPGWRMGRVPGWGPWSRGSAWCPTTHAVLVLPAACGALQGQGPSVIICQSWRTQGQQV